jgi:hypothetical protein
LEPWRLDPQGAQVGEAVELAVADFLDFDPETILQPLRGQMPVAIAPPDLDVGRSLEAEHHWRAAKGQQAVVDSGWVKTGQDFGIAAQIVFGSTERNHGPGSSSRRRWKPPRPRGTPRPWCW